VRGKKGKFNFATTSSWESNPVLHYKLSFHLPCRWEWGAHSALRNCCPYLGLRFIQIFRGIRDKKTHAHATHAFVGSLTPCLIGTSKLFILNGGAPRVLRKLSALALNPILCRAGYGQKMNFKWAMFSWGVEPRASKYHLHERMEMDVRCAPCATKAYGTYLVSCFKPQLFRQVGGKNLHGQVRRPAGNRTPCLIRSKHLLTSEVRASFAKASVYERLKHLPFIVLRRA
jgi:hypothetical protein